LQPAPFILPFDTVILSEAVRRVVSRTAESKDLDTADIRITAWTVLPTTLQDRRQKAPDRIVRVSALGVLRLRLAQGARQPPLRMTDLGVVDGSVISRIAAVTLLLRSRQTTVVVFVPLASGILQRCRLKCFISGS
jgi:hypothetical protein